MDRLSSQTFRVGDWRVDARAGELTRGGETARLDVRAMQLLQCLAERAGEVVSIDELLDKVWAGVTVSQDSVYQAVAGLRRQLGDDPKEPKYIATVPRLGYRMVAKVSPWTEEGADGHTGAREAVRADVHDAPSAPGSARSRRPGELARLALIWLAGAVALSVLVVAGFAVYGRIAGGNRAASAAARHVGDRRTRCARCHQDAPSTPQRS